MKAIQPYCLPILIPMTLLFGCAQKVAMVEINSVPQYADVYTQEGEHRGTCPTRLSYAIDETDRKRGHVNARGVVVRWVSGAEVKLDGLEVAILGKDRMAVKTVSRPADAPNAEADLAHAKQMDRHGHPQKEATVEINSDPQYAEVYNHKGEPIGRCPVKMDYAVDDSDRARGYVNAQGVVVRWVSGAEVKLDGIKVDLLGSDRMVVKKVGRPTDAPNAEADLAHVRRVEEQRRAEAARQEAQKEAEDQPQAPTTLAAYCRRLPDRMLPRCLAAAGGMLVDGNALPVCNRVHEMHRIDCIRAIRGRKYNQGVLEYCDKLERSKETVECLRMRADDDKTPAARASGSGADGAADADSAASGSKQTDWSKHPDVVFWCKASFTHVREVKCLRIARRARFKPSGILKACKTIIDKGDRMRCFRLAMLASYDPTAVVDKCMANYFNTDQKLECVEIAVSADTDPVNYFNACNRADLSSTGKIKCFHKAVKDE